MRQGCHPALHRGTAEQASTISGLIEQLGFPAPPTVDDGKTEPTVFTAYFYCCADLLAKEVRGTFSDLLEISLAQPHLLGPDPVGWAELQTKVLVADETYRISLWTKDACDKQTHDPSNDSDETIYWNKWRAPKWLSMQPFANPPFDRVTAWDRKDEAESRHLLQVVEDRFNQRLITELEKAVDDAHVQLAKRGNQSEWRSPIAQNAPAAKPRREVTKAPKPITQLSGTGGSTLPGPKLTQVPPDLPPYYPNDLKLQTHLIIAEAVREFPDQTHTPELCKCIITELTPHFRAAVQAGRMRADLALSDGGMGSLLHSLLVYNCDNRNERFRLEQEVRKSDEWLKFAREMVKVQSDPHGNEPTKALEMPAPQQSIGFTHSGDYRSVSSGGQTHSLTGRQAQVIQILHEAYKNGTPDVGSALILEKLETRNSRLRDTFKTNRRAWKALIVPGKTKGTLRLNL